MNIDTQDSMLLLALIYLSGVLWHLDKATGKRSSPLWSLLWPLALWLNVHGKGAKRHWRRLSQAQRQQYMHLLAMPQSIKWSIGRPLRTFSAKPVGVYAGSQPLIPKGEQSGLSTRIAATAENRRKFRSWRFSA
jgi:hypothetical protein